MQRLKFLAVSAMAGALVGALLWLLAPTPPVDAQAGITNFDNVTVRQDIIVGDDGTFGGNLSVAGVIAATSIITEDDLALVGDLDVGGDLQVTGLITGTSMTLTGDATIGDDLSFGGQMVNSAGAVSITDNVLIDGVADAVQLTVQGHSTNTSNLFVVENSAGVDQLTVGNTGNAGVTADLTVGDDLIVTDDASANDLTVADFANITAQAVITLTNNATLTATGSLQPIAAAGAIGIDGGTNIAHVTDRLTLINIGAQTITLTETTGLISAGNIALGAGDASTLVWANGGWIEISRSNN